MFVVGLTSDKYKGAGTRCLWKQMKNTVSMQYWTPDLPATFVRVSRSISINSTNIIVILNMLTNSDGLTYIE